MLGAEGALRSINSSIFRGCLSAARAARSLRGRVNKQTNKIDGKVNLRSAMAFPLPIRNLAQAVIVFAGDELRLRNMMDGLVAMWAATDMGPVVRDSCHAGLARRASRDLVR